MAIGDVGISWLGKVSVAIMQCGTAPTTQGGKGCKGLFYMPRSELPLWPSETGIEIQSKEFLIHAVPCPSLLAAIFREVNVDVRYS